MDGILSLFENITLPNNHAFIFEDYLKICAEHRVFVNKTANDLKPVLSFMNERLNSTSDRLEGLYLLRTFLPQCMKEIFRDNVLGWLHQCLKGAEGKNSDIVNVSYRLIKTIVEMTQHLPELRRNVGSIVVVKLVENLQTKSQNLPAALDCLETVMYNYGPACGHHKNVLEKILLQHIDSGETNIVHRLACCLAEIPLLSNSGPSGANHIARWIQEQLRLCATLHGILDELFYFVEDHESGFDVTVSSTKLPLPEISNDYSPLLKIIRLVNRFVNVAEILQVLLANKFSSAKSVNCEAILHLVCRGLNITGKSLSDGSSPELQMTRALLPRIHIALLHILGSLIICTGVNLAGYGSTICKQIYQLLSWTSTSKWTYSIEKPYRKLRVTACNTLVLWLELSNSASLLEKVADKLVHNLMSDIIPKKPAVTLIEDTTPKKGSSKQKKKSTVAERNNRTAIMSPDIELHLAANPNANSRICTAALKVMQWMLRTCSTAINIVIHEKLQTLAVRLLNDVTKTGKRDSLLVPYGNGQCRSELFRLLLMTVMNPHPMRPVPTNQALSIFATGSTDTYRQVAAGCVMGMGFLEKLVTGTRPTWHFPMSIEEMMDSMNAQREMEQEAEEEVEQIEDEVVEEEEEEVAEEEEEEDDDEEEEEEEEMEDELELSKIKIGEAVTLQPDKAIPEQMEVDEEVPVKKTENKKVQQPVEKPEANKKDEEDEVEVLTEDEREWPISKDRKEKIASEADEMMEDEEEYAEEEEEDEEGIEIRDDEELEEDYEDEDEDSGEIESEGEEIEHEFVMRDNAVKIIPVEVEKKEVTITEIKNDTPKSEVTQQTAENVTEVVLASTEHIESQDKPSLPSANSNEEKAKELDSSIEEVQVENVEQSNEIVESSVKENAEENKEVVNTATEETEESPAKEEHVSEKVEINSQNEVEEDGVVEETEFQDLEDHIAVSIVEKSKNGMEYQEIDDGDDVQDEGNYDGDDDGMHEECDEEQMEEENGFESQNDVPVEHQKENENEVLDASDKIIEENDKDVTKEPVQEPQVHEPQVHEPQVHESPAQENICETADNEIIEKDVATVENEVVQQEDDNSLKLEVCDDMDKQDAVEEGSGDKKEDTCEKEEFVSQQDSDIPKPEDDVLSDEVCTDKDNTVVDGGDSEANVAAISEVKAVEADVQMEVNDMPKTELNAAAQKMAHGPEDELEEPSRKKMKMDVTATITDGPKAKDTEISNVNAEVKLNSTGEVTNSERVMNGTATAEDEMTEEALIASFVPEVDPSVAAALAADD